MSHIVHEIHDKSILERLISSGRTFETLKGPKTGHHDNGSPVLHNLKGMLNQKSSVVEYNRTKTDHGRYYPRAWSIQSIPNDLRILISNQNGHIHDFDMVCAAGHILLHLFKQCGFDTEHQEKFLKDREGYLKMIDPDDRDRAKIVMNTSRFMKGVPKNPKYPPELVSYFHEFFENKQKFFQFNHTDPVIQNIKRRVMKKNNHKKDNHRGSFLSLVYQTYESMIIDVLLAKVKTMKGVQVRGIIHDGLNIECTPGVVNIETTRKVLEQTIERETKFKVPLKVKKFQITPDMLSLLEPAVGGKKNKKKRVYPLDTWIKDGLTVHNVCEGDMPEYQTRSGETRRSIKKLIFHKMIRILLVNANMGSGKTKGVVDLIHEHGNVKRMLFVTCRRVQDRSIRGTKGFESFVSYRNKTSDQVVKIPCLIIQYESLHKLEGVDEFDLIIIDEGRQILSQACAFATNGGMLNRNYEILTTLIQYIGKKVVILDADLEVDDMMLEFLKRTCDPKECALYRYKDYNPLKRSITFVEKPTLLTSMMVDLKKGKKVGLICRRKSTLKNIVSLMEEKVDSLPTMSIYDGCDLDDLKGVGCINDYLGENNVRLVCFSSKITVGVDIQVKFDSLYVVADDITGCTSMNITQMIGRFRSLGCTNIMMTIVNDKNEGWLSLQDAEHRQRTVKESREKYGEILKRKYNVRHRKWDFHCVNDDLFQLILRDLCLNESSFFLTFHHLCNMKGWEVIDMRPTKTNRSKKKGELKEDKKRAKEETIQRLNAILQVRGDEVFNMTRVEIDQIQGRIEREEYEKDDHCLQSIIQVVHRFLKYQDRIEDEVRGEIRTMLWGEDVYDLQTPRLYQPLFNFCLYRYVRTSKDHDHDVILEKNDAYKMSEDSTWLEKENPGLKKQLFEGFDQLFDQLRVYDPLVEYKNVLVTNKDIAEKCEAPIRIIEKICRLKGKGTWNIRLKNVLTVLGFETFLSSRQGSARSGEKRITRFGIRPTELLLRWHSLIPIDLHVQTVRSRVQEDDEIIPLEGCVVLHSHKKRKLEVFVQLEDLPIATKR